MIHIEPFKAEDWYLDDPVEIIDCPGKAIKHIDKMGIAWSAFDDDKCICCGGLIFWKEGEAEAWIRLDRSVLGESRRCIKAIMGVANITTEVFKGYIYCWVDVDEPVNQRFVNWFGFKKREELLIFNGKHYRLWEFDRDSVNDSRGSRKCGRVDAASKDGRAASGSPSKNK